MDPVQVRGESMNGFHRMCPYHEDVVYVMPQCVWLVWNSLQSICHYFHHLNGMLTNCSVDEVTLSSNQLTKVLALFSWTKMVYRRMSTTTQRHKVLKILTQWYYYWRTKCILKYTKRMSHDKIVSKETKCYIIQTDLKPAQFNILPEVQKHSYPGCPFVSSNSQSKEHILIWWLPSKTSGADYAIIYIRHYTLR